MGRVARGRLERERDDPLDIGVADRPRGTRAGLVEQAFEAIGEEASPPLCHVLMTHHTSCGCSRVDTARVSLLVDLGKYRLCMDWYRRQLPGCDHNSGSEDQRLAELPVDIQGYNKRDMGLQPLAMVVR